MLYSNLGGLNPELTGVRSMPVQDEDLLQRYNEKLRAQTLIQNQALMQNQLQNQAPKTQKLVMYQLQVAEASMNAKISNKSRSLSQ